MVTNPLSSPSSSLIPSLALCSPFLTNFQLHPYSISIRDAKKILYYILKTYFIYFSILFYYSSDIPVSIFRYNFLSHLFICLS